MKKTHLIAIIVFISISVYSQPKDYKLISKVSHTSVKDQAQAGSCWSFATSSFIEAEVLRTTGNEEDISETFFVYYGYINRAKYFVRLHGNNNFGQGGQAHDVLNIVKENGIVPESVYPHTLKDHSDLEKDLKNYLDSIVALDDLPVDWFGKFKTILDGYLGEPPTNFSYKGKNYTPRTFTTQYLKFDPNDYVELTSYTHHNFYKPFVLEVPDNWSLDLYYNIPINELVTIIDSALHNNYSICWDGDVSDPGFDVRNGFAYVSKSAIKSMNMTAQPYRQILFDRQNTTDDHLMHLVGVYKDIANMKQYQIKNSWGNYGPFKGYLFMSEDFVKYQTVAILVNKNAIPKKINDRINY